MRLTEPTDFEILEILADGGRNTAANISVALDKDRGYTNTRLPHLADYGLVKRIGPAPKSGLYEITPKGRIVLEFIDQYGDPEVDFDELIAEQLSDERSSASNR